MIYVVQSAVRCRHVDWGKYLREWPSKQISNVLDVNVHMRRLFPAKQITNALYTTNHMLLGKTRKCTQQFCKVYQLRPNLCSRPTVYVRAT